MGMWFNPNSRGSRLRIWQPWGCNSLHAYHSFADCMHRLVGQEHAYDKHDDAGIRREQVTEIGIANQWVDADSSGEASAARQRDRLPEMP